jgi:esterase/lipase
VQQLKLLFSPTFCSFNKIILMSKLVLYISIPLVLLALFYFLGPKPKKATWNMTLPQVPLNPADLEAYIAKEERKHVLKADNEARIVWNDSTKKKTPYSVIYLHGFSASYKEGDPVHFTFAKDFGCNLYLPRLADHGIDTADQLLQFTPDRFWASSKEALAIGKAIGDKVIVMSTSTGGTMAILLAAEFPDDVYALINLSPNIALNDPAAWLLNNPWGLQIARMVKGGDYNEIDFEVPRRAYWNSKYRLESVVQLEELLEEKMTTATFEKVKQPSLTLYYYKNEEEQDPTVKVSAMLEMHEALGTPADMKKAIAIPNAGAHVIGSYMVSNDFDTVIKEVEKFAEDQLKMKRVK